MHPDAPAGPLIDVRELRFRYPGSAAETLRGLDFSVRRGEIFGFLGPSGAGKSTTQKILTGLASGYAGNARVFGAEVRDRASDFYERLGVGFELPNLYSRLTGRENLEFFGSLYSRPTRPAAELMERVGLADAVDLRVSSFSKGMKMRLNFCRALINDPELLLLDEPTAGLDPGHGRGLKEMIREMASRGVTVFLTTHDMSIAAELCDRVAFLVDGRIVLIDGPRQLMLRGGERVVRVEHGSGDAPPAAREFPLDGLADDPTFLEILRTGEIQRIHTLEATLEDVFIAVTGKRLT